MMLFGLHFAYSTAHASIIDRQICGWYAIDFQDVKAINTHLDDDYYTANVDRPARGAKLQIWDYNAASPSWQSYWLSWNVVGSACATVSVNTTHDYALRFISDALVNGNTIKVRQTINGISMTAVASGPAHWDPDSGNVDIHSGIRDMWNVAAASGHAMYRRDGGVDNQIDVIDVRTTGGSSLYIDAATSEYTGSPIGTSMSSAHVDYKYAIAHELGHWVQDAANGFAGTQRDANVIPGDASCDDSFDDGYLIAKYNSSYAATEGIAWYYAVVAFNQTQDPHCEFGWPGDYNGDGDTLEANEEMAPSCEGEPAEDWIEMDWHGAYCPTVGNAAPSGVQLDWLRAFWDADTDQGLDTTSIMEIFSGAHPESWNAIGNNTLDDPKPRMETSAAAMSTGFGAAWNAVDDVNGLE
jgi:hypothetical protein